MNPLLIALISVFSVLATLAIVFLFSRKGPKPCYRCGGKATTEYMAIHYCSICRLVVIRMLPIVGLGGMPGFPGASGYTEFLPELKKKEEIDG